MATRLSTKLARRDDQHRVFVWRFFEGLSIEDCAEIEECGVATVKRDIVAGRQWLVKELGCALDGDEDVHGLVRGYLARRTSTAVR